MTEWSMGSRAHGLQVDSVVAVSELYAAAAAKSLQSCPTLCDPRDGSAPGSSVPGILQARTLEPFPGMPRTAGKQWVQVTCSR